MSERAGGWDEGSGGDLSTLRWRVLNAEKAISNLETWRDAMLIDHQRIVSTVETVGRQVAEINAIASRVLFIALGQAATVVGAVAAYYLTRGH